MSLLIKNALLRGYEELTDIYCKDGKIAEIGPALDKEVDRVIDAEGKLVSPRFIEPHIHLDKVNIVDSLLPMRVARCRKLSS